MNGTTASENRHSVKKGIVLAGGSGSRLYPSTTAVSKQLLPIYDKPLIFYPLSVLMLTGIRDVLLITTPADISLFQKLLGDGSNYGINIEYAVQPKPEGLAQAFIIGREFVANDHVALILGDNIFYGEGLQSVLLDAASLEPGAAIFSYYVQTPQQYAVLEFDQSDRVISIVEKPSEPKSNYAVPGIYFYDNQVVQLAADLQPSGRGELEITDVNVEYMKQNQLRVKRLGRGIVWLDTGTPRAMLEATNFVAAIEQRQGLKIACLEEIALRLGYLPAEQVAERGRSLKNSYGRYLLNIVKQIG